MSVDAFATALSASVARAPDDSADLCSYLESLHLEDLGLAIACAAAQEDAWEHFVRQFRPALYRAAEAIDPTAGRDLADSLYAELFGLPAGSGERKSLFRYFHGRSTLATWLRAVLAQRHVDRLRRDRRLDPLPDEESGGALRAPDTELDPGRERCVHAMRHALAKAVAELDARDRLRLGCYYAENLTLAEIGRLLGEHEATTSRHLTRTRRDIRRLVEAELRGPCRFSEAEAAQCFDSLVRDSGPLDVAEMVGLTVARKTDAPDRSTK